MLNYCLDRQNTVQASAEHVTLTRSGKSGKEIHLRVEDDVNRVCGSDLIAMNGVVLEPNVIMGFATGYDRSQLHFFLSSYNKHVAAGTSLLLFVHHRAEPLIAQDDVIYVIAHLGKLDEADVQISRFSAYRCFLEAAHGVERVLFVDTRDLIFQGNPFYVYTDQNVHFFQETSLLSIEQNGINNAWLQGCTTPQIARHYGGFPVQNAGCFIGPKAAVLKYTKVMVEKLKVTGCNDQGMHNLLLYTGHTDLDFPFVVDSNEIGQWFTGHAAIDTYSLNRHLSSNITSKITNKAYVALHQYDRIPDLKAHVEALYPIDVNQT